ncbi:hypothetical protein EJB05_24482, partial [Eragrostis curvula]
MGQRRWGRGTPASGGGDVPSVLPRRRWGRGAPESASRRRRRAAPPCPPCYRKGGRGSPASASGGRDVPSMLPRRQAATETCHPCYLGGKRRRSVDAVGRHRFVVSEVSRRGSSSTYPWMRMRVFTRYMEETQTD